MNTEEFDGMTFDDDDSLEGDDLFDEALDEVAPAVDGDDWVDEDDLSSDIELMDRILDAREDLDLDGDALFELDN